jgi:hypothetical protein
LKPVNPVHRHDFDCVAPRFGAFGEPGLEGLPGTVLDHVEQPRGAGALADSGQVDDHGDVLVATPGVAPHVLVDADYAHAVEPGGVVDEDALAFGQDRIVGGVPGDPVSLGDPGHRQMVAHNGFQCPAQAAAGQLGSLPGRVAGVLAPHVAASGAPVPADRDHQRGGSPAQRLVCQTPGHGVARCSFASTASAPPVRFDDPAGQRRPIRHQG